MSKAEFKADLTDFKNRFVRAHSTDKQNVSQSNSNFTVQYVGAGGIMDQIRGFFIKHISFPNMFLNVPSYANTFIFDESALPGPYTLSIPAGQYDVNQFAQAIEDAINASLSVGSVAVALISTVDQRLQFTFTGNTGQLIFADTTMWKQLGLTADTVLGAVIETDAYVNLLGTVEAFLHSRVLTVGKLIDGNGTFSVTDIVPIDVPFGSSVFLKNFTEETHKIQYYPYESDRTLRQIDVKLRDVYGNLLEIGPNFEMVVVLQAYHK